MLKKYLSWESLEKIRNNKVTNFLFGDILELGCGQGFIPNYLSKEGKKKSFSYTGVDFNSINIEKLRLKYPDYKFILNDLDEIVETGNDKFDTVISIAVIEHIYNQKNFLSTATKNLKIGGKLIITTPSNFGNDIVYPIMCKLGIREGKGVLNDHITIYNKDRFLVAANDFGLELEHFEFFELFCNQLVIFKKTKTI